MSYLCKSRAWSAHCSLKVLFEKSLEELWAPCSRYSRDGGPWSAPQSLIIRPRSSSLQPAVTSTEAWHTFKWCEAFLWALLTSQLYVQENRVITSAGRGFSARFCQSRFRLKTWWLLVVLGTSSRPSDAHKREHEICNYGQRFHKHPGPLIGFQRSGDNQMSRCWRICSFIEVLLCIF